MQICPYEEGLSDGQLAALAIDHGLTLHSTNTDFARFGEIRVGGPLR